MKHLLTLSLIIATLTNSFSQEPPFADYNASSPSAKYLWTNEPPFGTPIITEVPPWIISGGWRSYFFVPGSGETHLRSNPKSLLSAGNAFYMNDGTGTSIVTEPSNSTGMDWKRNYNGAYSAQYLHSNTVGDISIGFCHSENKNVVSGGCVFLNFIQNTINPLATINCADHDTYSGGDPYIDGWDAYHSLLTACWAPNNESTNWGHVPFTNELGPIAWPSLPYRTADGRKITGGFRHPSSIVWNNEIYIYVLQEAAYGYRLPKYQGVPLPPIVNEDGRQGGIKVIKVHKDEAHDPSKYKIYYNGQWYPSLPNGLNKNNILNYTTVAGPTSTSVIPQLQPDGSFSVPNRFNVAWIRNTSYFAGLEEYFENGVVKIALRLSTDLVNWSNRKKIVYEAPSWEKSVMRYPIFLSVDGWKNNEIDQGNFYIVGAGTYDNGAPTNQINLININSGGTRPPRRMTNEPQTFVKGNESTEAGNFQYKVFPNPVKEQLTISVNGSTNMVVAITLLDISGRKMKSIYNGNLSAPAAIQTLDLTDLNSGVYLLEINSNNKKYIEKVIKM